MPNSGYNMVMIFLELFRWWYGPGWALMFNRISERFNKLAAIFAIPTLLKTLFAPWKRIMTTGAKSLDDKMKALLDNLVSRVVGFTVRSIVLWTAFFMLSGSLVYGVLLALIWPLVPPLIVFFFILGLT